jgi:transcriptional antiterminator RfaH
MKEWYAVQSRPRQEALAELNLDRQGYQTYLPKILLRKRRRDKWTRVVEPLFPRYLFIQVDSKQQSLAPVRSTLGVAGLVRFGQLLRPVPNSVIDYIRQAENPETHQQHADAWPHQPGDTVQVLDGPFAGLSGIFQAPTGEERAMLLIELLGRQNTIDVAMDAIAAGA